MRLVSTRFVERRGVAYDFSGGFMRCFLIRLGIAIPLISGFARMALHLGAANQLNLAVGREVLQ
jgi:hypothetical protein